MRHKSKTVGCRSNGFILVEPSGLMDSGEIARKLRKCGGVREVHLTTGRYGFVIKANAASDEELSSISTKVKKITNGKSVSVAIGQFVYR